MIEFDPDVFSGLPSLIRDVGFATEDGAERVIVRRGKDIVICYLFSEDNTAWVVCGHAMNLFRWRGEMRLNDDVRDFLIAKGGRCIE